MGGGSASSTAFGGGGRSLARSTIALRKSETGVGNGVVTNITFTWGGCEAGVGDGVLGSF